MPAALDVGTNTVRLLVGEVTDGKLLPHYYFRRITRLGGGLSDSQGLAPEAMERTLRAFAEVRALLDQHGVTRVRGVGTQALRRAVNADAFLEQARGVLGFDLEIISGNEEAVLSSAGILSALDAAPAAALMFDIGGGSTEFVLWQGEVLFHRSYPLGVVSLAECADAAQQQAVIDATLAQLRRDLQEVGLWPVVLDEDCAYVGTAGTVTTLAAMQLGMTEYDWRRVNNLRLSRGDLQKLCATLAPLTIPQRESLPGMEEGRGDLILPGAGIVSSLLDKTGHSEIVVSDFGLLEGVLLGLSR